VIKFLDSLLPSHSINCCHGVALAGAGDHSLLLRSGDDIIVFAISSEQIMSRRGEDSGVSTATSGGVGSRMSIYASISSLGPQAILRLTRSVTFKGSLILVISSLLVDSVLRHLESTNPDDGFLALRFTFSQLLNYVSPFSRCGVFGNAPFLESPFILCFTSWPLAKVSKLLNFIHLPFAEASCFHCRHYFRERHVFVDIEVKDDSFERLPFGTVRFLFPHSGYFSDQKRSI
jgi:hypothetical protein